MAAPHNLIDHLRLLAAPLKYMTDAILLDRFIQNGEEAAFTALVARYGPMVIRVCRRVLADAAAAEDCFQATFLVLARKARVVRRRESLAAWLHSVALRVASKARKNRRQFAQLPANPEPADRHPDPLEQLSARELLLAVDEEVQRLPEKYRIVVILCCLENLSQEAAARRLGWTAPSVKARLERGRRQLEAGLARRGFTLSASLAGTLLCSGPASVGPGFRAATVRAALAFGSGLADKGIHGLAPAAVMARAAMKSMRGIKAKMALWALTLVLVVGAGMVASGAWVTAKIGEARVSPTKGKMPGGGAGGRRAEGPQPVPLPNEKKQTLLMAQGGHTQWIRSLAFSPDNKHVLTGSVDGTARLWDAATGKEIRRFEGHTHQVASAAFSRDGKLLLTASWDNTARLWDTATGKELRSFKGHAERVWSASFSPDGRNVLTSSDDKTARLWSLATGNEVRRFEGHTEWVLFAVFSPDGKQVLTGSWDLTARLWDVASGKEIHRFEGHADRLTCAAFSPDGKQAITACYDGKARLWDTVSGKEIRAFADPDGDVRSAIFSPDGKEVLTASWGHAMRVWDTATGKEMRGFDGDNHFVSAMAFSSDGKKVLTSSYDDNSARMWNAATGKEIRSFKGNSNWVFSVAFSPDGKHLITATGKEIPKSDNFVNTVLLWDASRGQVVRGFVGHTDLVATVAFSPDGKQVLTGSSDRTARLWDTATGKEMLRFLGHGHWILSSAFSPDGKQVLTGSADQTARLWDAATGKEIQNFQGHADRVTSVAFSPDASKVLTGSWDKKAKLWDVATGKSIRTFLGHSLAVDSVAFSPDGKQVLTGSFDNVAKLWEVATGNERRSFPGGRRPVAFSPDGRMVLAPSTENTARLWDTVSGKEVRSFTGHGGWVNSAAFSPDGKHVLTGSSDGTARLWDCVSGRELCSLLSFRDQTWAVLDLDGRYDSSNNGDIEWLHGVAGNEVVPLKQLKGERYDPGLLAKYMGFNKEPPRTLQRAK